MFLIVSNVYAKDYYTEYGSFSKWSTDYVEKDELTDVEEKRLYKYYHEDIVGDYYLEDSAPLDYIIDKSKYKYGSYSSYSENLPEVKKGRIIESKEVLEYQKMVPISYIFIFNTNNFVISEIDITDSKGNNVNFDINCTNCSKPFSSQLNNNSIYDYNLSEIDFNIMIKLRTPLYYDDINIDIYLYDEEDKMKSFDIAGLSDEEDVILLDNFRNYFKSYDQFDIKKYSFNYSNMIVTNKWESTKDKTLDNHTLVTAKYLYRYKDIYYYYYKKNIIYSDYLEKATKYYPYQTEEYITYYRYRKRTKVLYDELLSEYNDLSKKYKEIETSLNDSELSIKNLNNDIEVLRKEYIEKIDEMNKENVSNYNEYITDINECRLEVSDLEISKEKDKLLLEAKEEEKNKIVKEFDNELLNLKMEEKTEEVRTMPLLKIGNNYIYILPIIFLILILLVLYLLKNKKKN